MRTHDTLAIANWLLDRARADGKPLSPMKLQKLIYLAHGWALALADVALIDERPQAWSYGPVIPSVYHEFKEFGRNPINTKATRLGPVDGQEFPEDMGQFERIIHTEYETTEPKIENDPDAIALLERVWEVYGSWSAVQLSNMTHEPGSAWDEAYKRAQGRRHVVIPDTLIKAEFDRKLKRGAGAAAD